MAKKAESNKAEPEKRKKAAAKPGRPKRAVQDKPVPAKKESPEALEVVDTELVAKSVAFINKIMNDTGEKASSAIGKHILETYFDNNAELAKSHNPKKAASYRALLTHSDLMLSPSSLNSMVRVEVQQHYLTGNGIDLSKLSYSHQARLIRLPDGRDKLSLAKKAIKDGLSVRSLEDEVKERSKLVDRQVPLIPNFGVDFEHNPALLLGNSKRLDFVLEKENLKKLSQKKREELKEKIIATRDTLKKFESDLEVIVKNLDEIEVEEEKGKEES